MVNTNLALGVKKSILGPFNYTRFLDLISLTSINLILFVSIIPILSTLLLSPPIFLMAPHLLINSVTMILSSLVAVN